MRSSRILFWSSFSLRWSCSLSNSSCSSFFCPSIPWLSKRMWSSCSFACSISRFARSYCNFAVFCCNTSSSRRWWFVSIFWRICAPSFSYLAISASISVRRAFHFFVCCSSSSISRRLPNRLLLLRKAPPDIEPPGFKSSPSVVTIRIVWWYFLAKAIAWSIWSTTTKRPSKYSTNSEKRSSASTRVDAIPITPGSAIIFCARLAAFVCILVNGKNVALP